MDTLWNKPTLQIYKALDGQVRLVGGCIRDYLLRRPVHDRDMTTPLPPDEVEKALTKANIDFISIGKKYGTIAAKIDNTLYEITTLRKETKHDGRHAEMAWTTSYKTDALRRDFKLMLCLPILKIKSLIIQQGVAIWPKDWYVLSVILKNVFRKIF